MSASIFNSTCRTCNSETTELLNIFESKIGAESPELIANLLNQCGPIKLVEKGDDYPEYICHPCAKKLEETHRFLKSWYQSEAEFEVALKYEKRRKRMIDVQPQQQNYTIVSLDKLETVPIETTTNNGEEMIFFHLENDVIPVDTNCNSDGNELNAELKINGTSQSSCEEIIDNENRPNQVICDSCNRSFFTTSAMEIHRKLVHRNNSR